MAEKQYDVSWPGWNVAGILGHGSYGRVYAIERDVFGHTEKAALKVISIPQNDGEIEELYNDGYDSESITQRFKSYLQDIVREYSLMSEMKGHTNIVYCDDLRYVQHDDGMGWDIYIKMELLTPLPKILGNGFSEKLVVKLGLDICNALILCKSKNIVHRDIKPQNIFVSEDKNFKLGDFGIAKTAERTTSGTKTGTYKYMAPEVYNNQPYGHAADIYSLGMVLYWLLNERRTPFLPLPPKTPTATDEDRARNSRFAGLPIPEPAHGSNELKRIVLKACAFSPEDRYKNAAEMRNDLLSLVRNGSYTAQNLQIKSPIVTKPQILTPVSDTDETVGNFGRAQREKTPSEETVGIFSSNTVKGNAQKRKNSSLSTRKENSKGRKHPRPSSRDERQNGRHLFDALIVTALILALFGVGFTTVFSLFEKKTDERVQIANSMEITMATEKTIASTINIQENVSSNPERVSEFAYIYEKNDTGITISGFKGELPEAAEIPAEIDGLRVTEIGDKVFYERDKLRSISIPESVTHIGKSAFFGCSSLSRVAIPYSVSSIGDKAFLGCENLCGIAVNRNCTVGEEAFPDTCYVSGYSFEGYGTASLGFSIRCIQFDEEPVIPLELRIPSVINGFPVTSIEDSAFSYCKSLSSVTIPDSVTSIGDSAFYKCTNLSSVTIPDSVTSIGYSAFEECTSLSSVSIPNSVTSIEYTAFFKCTSLSTVTIPDSVTSIGEFAFGDCTSLSSVSIPNSVTSIGYSAFSYCANLSSVTIPDGVTSIGGNAFSYCKSLSSVTIPDSVTSIGEYTFFSCKSLSSIIIPDSVTDIEKGVFEECTSLSNVTIPYSVTSIGDFAFYKCENLSSVTINQNCVTSLYAFPSSCRVSYY